MDINRQVEFWMQSSQEDLEVAEQLLHSGKIRHGLFFLHLALEKALKAHVCNKTMDIAPRTHNLVRLAELADLKLAQQQRWVLADMNPYNLEGRYPHILSPIPDKQEVLRLLCKSKETIQ